MERRLVLVAACAFVVAAVLYSAWLPGQFATPGVDRTNGYVSELAARDQPWSGLFRLTDALAGLACLIGVACVTRDDRREWGGWLAMALFSVLTAVDALFPLDCAALSDPACERRPLSLSHHVHAVTSVLAVGAVIAAMVLLGLRFRSRVAWTLAVAMGAVSVFMLAAMTHQALVGAAQRAQLALIACWLLYLGVRLLTREPAVPSDAPRVRQAGGKHVVRQGAGPAVIIASGMAGAWYHWDRVAGELARDHLVTRFDRPGLGLSGPPSGPPTLYGEAARLAALAPAHPEHVTIVAHSVAAWHAEAFARLHPLRVAALVLVDPAPEPPRGSTQTGRAIGLWLPLLGETWGAQGLAWLLGPLGHRIVMRIGDHEGVYRSGRVLAAALGEWLAYRDMALELRSIRSEHALPDIPVTILSTGGAEGLAELLNAQLIRLRGAGHQVHLDNPGAIIAVV